MPIVTKLTLQGYVSARAKEMGRGGRPGVTLFDPGIAQPLAEIRRP